MIEITKKSGIYQLVSRQALAASREELWDFLSDPGNLKVITPEHMNFEITTDPIDRVYPGVMISYRVSPLPGLRTNWVTEITHVQEGQYFVDEQRVGPYVMWHHEHHILEEDGQMWMHDIVTYKLPMGALGNLVGGGFVQGQLRQVFQYREDQLEKIFNQREVLV